MRAFWIDLCWEAGVLAVIALLFGWSVGIVVAGVGVCVGSGFVALLPWDEQG